MYRHSIYKHGRKHLDLRDNSQHKFPETNRYLSPPLDSLLSSLQCRQQPDLSLKMFHPHY
ncbi:MAG: hypothetical protein P1V19_10370 [Gimesia sp.]|nr:hypothetical protein [Gimesia sp.]